MSLFTTLMVLTLVGSMTFCLVALWRVLVYNRKYHLPENKYTKLFNFLTIGHIASLYALVIFSQIFVTIWFLWTL